MKELLIQLNFNLSSVGFRYWLLAIEISRHNPTFNMERIYKETGKKFKKSRCSIERAMRECAKNNSILETYNFKYKKKLTTAGILRFLVLESEV